MGKALSSSLTLEPFVDLLWLSALHVRNRIHQLVGWFKEEGGGGTISVDLFCLFYNKIQIS